VEDGVAAVVAGSGEGGRLREDLFDRVDFYDVHEAEHFAEAGVWCAVHITVAEHLDEVGVVGLDDFVAVVIPEGEAFYLDLGVVVSMGSAAVLGAGVMDEREGVLVIDGQQATGELHAGTGDDSLGGAKKFQVRIVGIDAVVLGAGDELEVFSEQVEHSTALARGVVAGGGGVAVEFGTEPAGGVDGACELGFKL